MTTWRGPRARRHRIPLPSASASPRVGHGLPEADRSQHLTSQPLTIILMYNVAVNSDTVGRRTNPARSPRAAPPMIRKCDDRHSHGEPEARALPAFLPNHVAATARRVLWAALVPATTTRRRGSQYHSRCRRLFTTISTRNEQPTRMTERVRATFRLSSKPI